MALEIDAFHVLRAIGSEPSPFAAIRAEIAKATGKFTDTLRALLVKQVKANAGDLDALRSVRRALGAQTFDLVTEGMKDSEITTLVGKIDKHHPEQKVANEVWRRGHLRALAAGAIEPAAQPEKKPKQTRSKTGKSGTGRTRAGSKAVRGGRRRRPASDDEFLFDPSAGAVRDRNKT